MLRSYDLVVIGTVLPHLWPPTAAAQQVGASRSSTTCHSAAPCALRGCDPKKVLVGVAEAIDHARRMRGKGIGGGRLAGADHLQAELHRPGAAAARRVHSRPTLIRPEASSVTGVFWALA
ncbi:MAG TPA: hypothetical protein VNZ53_30880 [Steroidobacteraceae bacterium]|nr:hypothetical protein [Steroidobacteraceae bacterium]